MLSPPSIIVIVDGRGNETYAASEVSWVIVFCIAEKGPTLKQVCLQKITS